MEALVAMGLWNETPAFAETKITSSVSASERYDTNVFFAPAQFLPPGRQRSDFVSSVASEVEVLNKTRQTYTSLKAGVSGNAFVTNRDLNFISTNFYGFSNLDHWISQFLPGAKLQVADTFRYTPEPPPFFTGVKPQLTADPFSRGLVTFRANTFVNNATVQGQYPLSRTVSLLGDYSYSIFRFGSIFVTTPTGASSFFDTTVHTWSTGPSARLTRADTVNLKFQETISNQTGSTGQFSFTAQSLTAEYVRTTPAWTALLSGGATHLLEGDLIFPSGRVSLYGDYLRSVRVRVDLSRAITPSFFGTGGALISNVAQLSIQSQLSKLLTFTGNVNYAFNELVPGNTVTFHSYTGSLYLAYRLTKTVSTSLEYGSTRFNTSVAGQVPYYVQRNFVMLSITAKWY